MTLGESIVSVPRVCIIRTRSNSTLHTVKWASRNTMYYDGYIGTKGHSMRGLVYILGVSYVYLEKTSFWLRALHTQIDTLALGKGILCELGVYIILPQSKQHTDKMTTEVGILCVPGVYILIYSTQHTDRYNGPRGRYTMCTWSIHYTDPQYTTHR